MKRPSNFLIIAFILIALGAMLFVGADISNDQSAKEVNVANETRQNDNAVSPPSAYRDYSPEIVASMSEDDRLVLFFHAAWCPTCHVLDKDIEANADKMPDDVQILKVDYDKETELKQKYGVRLQHTLVQIDRNGEKIALWHQSPTLADLLSELR